VPDDKFDEFDEFDEFLDFEGSSVDAHDYADDSGERCCGTCDSPIGDSGECYNCEFDFD
jgi:hypothetical protein